MKKTVEIEECDLCGKETKTYRMAIPTYRTFDAEEGKIYYSEKQFYQETLDLCKECLEKISVVHSIGIQCQKYEIDRKRVDSYEENK